MNKKSPSVRDNGLVRRLCAGPSRFDDAPQVSDEQATIARRQATFLADFADMLDPSPAAQELRLIALHLRVLVGDIA